MHLAASAFYYPNSSNNSTQSKETENQMNNILSNSSSSVNASLSGSSIASSVNVSSSSSASSTYSNAHLPSYADHKTEYERKTSTTQIQNYNNTKINSRALNLVKENINDWQTINLNDQQNNTAAFITAERAIKSQNINVKNDNAPTQRKRALQSKLFF